MEWAPLVSPGPFKAPPIRLAIANRQFVHECPDQVYQILHVPIGLTKHNAVASQPNWRHIRAQLLVISNHAWRFHRHTGISLMNIPSWVAATVPVVDLVRLIRSSAYLVDILQNRKFSGGAFGSIDFSTTSSQLLTVSIHGKAKKTESFCQQGPQCSRCLQGPSPNTGSQSLHLVKFPGDWWQSITSGTHVLPTWSASHFVNGLRPQL